MTVVEPALSDAAARLAIATRDVEQLEQRWRTEVLERPQVTAANQQYSAAEAEATAQLKAGRRDKLAGQVADVRTQIETITGDLAIAAAAGTEIGAQLRMAGTLLNRCAKLTMTSSVADQVGTVVNSR